MRSKLCRSLPVLLALAACAPAGRCRLEALSQTPLQARGGFFYTQMVINGHAATMIVDSGAFLSLLTADAVERYGVRTISAAELQGSVKGIGGSRDFSVVAPGQMAFGRLTSDRFKLISTDWTPPKTTPPTDGLIGADILGAFDVDYDLLGGKLTLYNAAGRCAAPPTGLTGDLFRADMVRVPGHAGAFLTVSIGGEEVTALLDTGAAVSLLFRGAASRLGLDYDALAADGKVERIGGLGPDKVDAVRRVLPAVVFGDITVHNLPVMVVNQRLPGAGMLLGQDFLNKVHVWVSNSGRALIFQLPPQASPPVDFAATR